MTLKLPLERRAPRLERAPLHRVFEQVVRHEAAAVLERKRIALVDRAARRDMKPLVGCRRHALKISKRVRVVQFPVLREALRVVRALHHVDHPEADEPAGKRRGRVDAPRGHAATAVGAGEELAILVVVQSPHVAATLGE